MYGPTTLISGQIDLGPSSRTASSSAADSHVYRFGSIVGVIPPLPLRVSPPPPPPPLNPLLWQLLLLLLRNEVGLRLK